MILGGSTALIVLVLKFLLMLCIHGIVCLTAFSWTFSVAGCMFLVGVCFG